MRNTEDQPSRTHKAHQRRFDRFMCAVIAGIVLYTVAVWWVIVHFIVKFW